MVEATYKFEVDWSNDGDYLDTGENVTTRVLGSAPFISSWGRRQYRRLSPPAASRASFRLDNTSGDYYPDNGGSPITGNVAPGRPVHVECTFSAVTYDLFSGNLFNLNFTADPFGPFVDVDCLDVVNTLARSTVSVGMLKNALVSDAIDDILDAVGWPAGDRSIDTSVTSLPVWWVDGQTGWEAILDLLEVEGPPAVAYVDPDGTFHFKSRHHRLIDTRSKTSQDTFRKDTTEPTFTRFWFDPGWRDVINKVEILVRPWVWASTAEEVWNDDTPRDVEVGPGTVDVEVRTDTPWDRATATVSFLSGDPDDTTAVLSGEWPNITLSLDYTGVSRTTVSNVTIDARTYSQPAVRLVSDSDATSQTAYGTRTWRSSSPWWQVENEAADIATVIINERKDPRKIASVTLDNGNATRFVAGLDRQISDMVTVNDTESSINSTFHVESIRHEVRSGGKYHQIVLGLEDAGTPLVAATEVFILDDGTQGKLGTGKLGY